MAVDAKHDRCLQLAGGQYWVRNAEADAACLEVLEEAWARCEAPEGLPPACVGLYPGILDVGQSCPHSPTNECQPGLFCDNCSGDYCDGSGDCAPIPPDSGIPEYKCDDVYACKLGELCEI
jgi:hypothetical protein